MTPDSDFLFLEGLLVARLKTALGDKVFVHTAADLNAVTESGQATPAVHVLYRGYRVANAETDGFVGVVQTWLTVVAVRNVRNTTSGEDARLEAGPLATDVLDALYGARFSGARSLRLANGPDAGYLGGHFYLPLAWHAGVYFKPPCG